ncbi:MAG TPA: alcohol dehydrogenase [Thiotrichales bacterium]|nr:alcohol dehydrogenase [Thiotrichales bacterium]
MKAVVMTRPGTPEVLETVELPRPEIRGERDLLIRVRAAGVNPVDTKLRARGTYLPQESPAILGCDGAGVVEAVGGNVRRFAPGDEVWWFNGGIGGPHGNYAEYVVVEEPFVAPKPRSLSFEEAAGGPLVLITAWESLYDRARLGPRDTVLIHAGAGGVGHVAVQLAAHTGSRVLTTVGSAEKADFVRGLGAHEAILYRERDFVEAVRELTEGRGADLALDTVGGETMLRTAGALRLYGHLVTLLEPPAEASWKEARIRNLSISLELMLTPLLWQEREARAHQTWILEECTRLADRGKLKIHVGHTLPLERAPEAHRLIEAGGMTGKAVLTLDG